MLAFTVTVYLLHIIFEMIRREDLTVNFVQNYTKNKNKKKSCSYLYQVKELKLENKNLFKFLVIIYKVHFKFF